MRTRLLQWLFRRSKPYTPPLWREQRIHELIADDLAAHPEMCVPILGRETRHVTRVIDRRRTRTMETLIVR